MDKINRTNLEQEYKPNTVFNNEAIANGERKPNIFTVDANEEIR